MKFCFSPILIPDKVSTKDWFNWKWQLCHSFKKREDFDMVFSLTKEQKQAFQISSSFSIQSTPYYTALALAHPPLQKIILPNIQEGKKGQMALKDPLGEENHSPVKHLVHRYPDRVLFLVTDMCPIYCRYCTRKRWTSQEKKVIPQLEYQKALTYIKENVGIREVILSGGDPLILADPLLEKILKDLRAIQHIEIIRIGSRMPAVCPMRFTTSFAQMVKQYQPVFIMSHFNHPAEITQESAESLSLLADHGIPVYNQMVLIRGLNNHPAVVQALSRRLLFLRARPYYMFQCDPSLGTDHLRTSIKNSRWIQKSLWGVFSSLATPKLAVDLPGGGGKVELTVESQVGPTAHSPLFQGWDGQKAVYQEPEQSAPPREEDISPYLREWESLCQQKYGRELPD